MLALFSIGRFYVHLFVCLLAFFVCLALSRGRWTAGRGLDFFCRAGNDQARGRGDQGWSKKIIGYTFSGALEILLW